MDEILEKVSFTTDTLTRFSNGKKPWVQVDGGINLETFAKCAKAGATSFVVGTHLFSLPDMKQGIEALENSIKGII